MSYAHRLSKRPVLVALKETKLGRIATEEVQKKTFLGKSTIFLNVYLVTFVHKTPVS